MAEILYRLKLIALLLSRPLCRMVTHQRCKYTQRQPAQQHIPCRIGAESAQICTGIQETAHI